MDTPRTPSAPSPGVVLPCGLVWSSGQLPIAYARCLSSAALHALINLVFHEAGHIIFAPLGSFMMTLGGSLMQVIVPFACAWAFFFQREDRFAASVCSWWAGQSLIDLSPYIDDARSLQLMLLGGPAAEVEGHDWESILIALGWLHLDHAIAKGVWYCGAALMLAALVYSFFVLRSSLSSN